MAEGFTIPIEGDADPFRRALAELRAAVSQVTAAMRGQAAAATQAGNASAAGLDRTLQRAGSLGNAVGGLATGFSVASQAARQLGRVKMAGGIRAALTSSKGLREGMRSVGTAMRSLMRSKTFRVIAVGAAAAVVSVLAIRTAWKAVRGAARLAGRVISGAMRAARGAVRGLRAGISGLRRGLASLGAMFSAALPITGLMSLVGLMAGFGLITKKAVGEAQNFETMRVRVEQFTGSVQAAKDLFEELDQFEIETPFSGDAIRNTAVGLLGAGVQDDIAAIVRELGAVAKSGQDLEDLGMAMAKGFARGKFQTEELNKFTERQINLMPELAAVTGLTGEALRKAVEAGLSFDQVREAIARLSGPGGQFEGLLKRLSLTGQGLMSTLGSGIQLLLREFGQPINDALRPMLQQAIGLVGSMRQRAREMGEAVGKAMSFVFAAFKTGRLGDVLKLGFRVAVTSAIDLMMRGFRGAVAFLATALPPIFAGATSKLKDPVFWQGLGEIFSALGKRLTAEVKDAFGHTKEADIYRKAAATDFEVGQGRIAKAGKGQAPGEMIADALADGFAAAREAAGGPASEGTLRARDDLRALFAELGPVIRKLREGAVVPGPGGSGRPEGPAAEEEEPDRAARPIFATIASSMSRIGGGGVGFSIMEPLAAESKKQTKVQHMMEKHLRHIAEKTSPVAVYA